MRSVDDKYYEVIKRSSLTEHLLVSARRRIYNDFIAYCRPTPASTILDVGVSDVINDGANLVERHYPRQEQITAAGLGDGAEFRAAFPNISYKKISANAKLPFGDRQFDIATSNAVIEHVGSVANQRAFLAEMRRVSKQAFISAPNRLFPVEHHTSIPLAHFHDASFRMVCRWLGKSTWLDPVNLILMDANSLQALAPDGRVGMTGLPLGPFSSNLFLHIATS